jgi:hypothetical protein
LKEYEGGLDFDDTAPLASICKAITEPPSK